MKKYVDASCYVDEAIMKAKNDPEIDGLMVRTAFDFTSFDHHPALKFYSSCNNVFPYDLARRPIFESGMPIILMLENKGSILYGTYLDSSIDSLSGISADDYKQLLFQILSISEKCPDFIIGSHYQKLLSSLKEMDPRIKTAGFGGSNNDYLLLKKGLVYYEIVIRNCMKNKNIILLTSTDDSNIKKAERLLDDSPESIIVSNSFIR